MLPIFFSVWKYANRAYVYRTAWAVMAGENQILVSQFFSGTCSLRMDFVPRKNFPLFFLKEMDKRKNLFPLRFKGLTCYIQYNLCDCTRVLVWAFNRYAGTKENVTGFLISALFCNYSHTKVIEFIFITSCGKCFKNGWKLINNDWLAFFKWYSEE